MFKVFQASSTELLIVAVVEERARALPSEAKAGAWCFAHRAEAIRARYIAGPF